MTAKPSSPQHGIKDNHTRGKVADFLGAKLTEGSRLSVVSAYFTIYAYEALSKELDGIESLRFLFGEPRFIQSLDPEKTDKKSFKIEDEGLELANRLQQKEVVITREQRDALVAQDPQSVEIIKPYLKGRNIKRWSIEPDDEFLVYAYRGVDIKSYPAVLMHLQTFKTKLIERSGEQQWYELQASPADTDRFTSPKIIYPDIATGPQFAWDKDQFFSADTTFMIPNAEKSTLGILNSSTTAWFFSQISPSVMNSYFRFKSQYCQQIPIPATNTQQVDVLECIVEAVTAGTSRPEYERLLNGLVYELFFPEDLHAKNIRLFDACAAAGIKQGMDAQAVAARIFRNDHPIYGMLFDLPTLDVVRLIESLE